jgi:hypothetical protein
VLNVVSELPIILLDISKHYSPTHSSIRAVPVYQHLSSDLVKCAFRFSNSIHIRLNFKQYTESSSTASLLFWLVGIGIADDPLCNFEPQKSH